jgi:hypothetical protein
VPLVYLFFIDRLNLESSKEGRRDTSFGDRTPHQYFWLKLANSIVFYGVFSNSSVQKPCIPVKVLCENVKYFSSSITITFRSQKSLRRRNRHQRGTFSTGVLGVLTPFLWIKSFFSKFEEL